jgi:glycosyltransferase involved in cell wall biosynthesis
MPPHEDRGLPLVSVCIPTRNRSGYLSQAIGSVLAQTFGDFELIVSDNASTDGTAEAVARFDDPRLRYVGQPDDRGMTANWLRAVDATSGRYLAILGDDDWWDPHFLERLVAGLESGPHFEVAFSDHWLVDAEGGVLTDQTDRCSRRHGRTRMAGGWVDFLHAALADQALLPSASLFRRARFVESRGLDPQTRTSPAYLIYGKLALSGSAAYYVPERLAYYRLHPGSATNTTVLQNWTDFQWACARLVAEFSPRTPGIALVRQSWVRSLEVEGALRLRRAEWGQARRAFWRALGLSPFRIKAWLGLMGCAPVAYRPYRWLRDHLSLRAAWA